MQRFGVLEHAQHQRVTGLVVGGHFLVFLIHCPATSFTAPTHLVARLFQLVHADGFLVATGGKQRRLVDQVGEIRAGEARRAPPDHMHVDVLGQLDVAGVDFQNGFAAGEVGHINHDLPIKSSRTQQRRIEHIRAVGGGDDDHAFLGVKPVHFHQQRVQRLLPFVMTTANPAEP